MFGDGSNGALNVSTGSQYYLSLNTKYQFTTVNIASGGTLTTNSTTGSVLYILAKNSFTLNGIIDVSNVVNYGNNSWGITLDSEAFTSPGVMNGGGNGGGSNPTERPQVDGFGGAGRGGYVGATSGGLGGTSSSSGGSGGTSTSLTVQTYTPDTYVAGTNGGSSAGGSGASYAAAIRTSGNLTYRVVSGNSGRGGNAYGENGQNGTDGSATYLSGSGTGSNGYAAAGGGGGGGRAGRAGVHVVIKSPVIILNGQIITSGSSGGNGGNGGLGRLNGAAQSAYNGFAGAGGGGGNGGNIKVVYAGSLTDTSTKTMAGGSKGFAGGGSSSHGTDGSNGSFTSQKVVPIADFTGSPTSGVRPLTVAFTDLSSGGDSWLWDFGDSSTSTLQNPSHIYSSVGSYTVTLTTTNSVGSDSEVKTNYIVTTINTFTREAKGTLIFSGAATRKYIARREAKGTLLFSGSAFAIRITDPSVIDKKTYLYKVYDEDNNFIGVWDDVVTEPNWSEEINTAGSSMDITLARNSDSLVVTNEQLLDSNNVAIKDSNNFDILTSTESRSKVGPGSNVNHNYRVDIFVFYGEVSPILDSDGVPLIDSDGETIDGTTGAPNGRRIFTGFISEINTKYGDDENTDVQLMSYGFDLDQYPVVNSSGETTVAFNSVDPAQIIRTGIDRFKLDGINTFTDYTSSTVQNSGTTVSYTFRSNTYKELLDKALQLAPSNYYYYVDLGSNLIYFHPKPSTAQHLFYLGKHFKALKLRSYIGDVVNDVLFTGGGDPALYRRTTRTPITGTRRGLSRLSDNRVTLDTSADILAEGELDSKENIQYRSTIEILDKTYDLESINIGDMVGFRNFDNYVDGLMMQIVAKNYTPDVLTLQLDTLPVSVPKRLEELRKALNTQETTDVPALPL